jgi:MATE family multidrug resistance protein
MVGHMLLGLTDTMMVGRVGVLPLAGAALVNTVTQVPMIFGIGLLSAVQVLTSQAFGARKPAETAETVRHGFLVALAAGILTGVLMTLAGPYLQFLGPPGDVVQVSQNYLLYFSWSIVPLLIAHAGKQFCESLNDPWPPMFILLGSVLLNIFLNWVFIFGHLGAPAMGLDGAGLATLIARVVMMIGTIVYLVTSKREKTWRPKAWMLPLSVQRFRDQLRLGAPVALQHLIEVGAFSFGGLMMGWIGAEAMAAHQVALTCAATTFMLALGIGMGVSIRVGHAWGANLKSRLPRIVTGGLAMGLSAMALFAVAFMFGGRMIASWFLQDEAVILLAAKLLVIAAFFQLADGTQVIMISALRGMSDVRVPVVVVAIAYWAISVPLAYFLAFTMDLGAVGNWIGLACGLGVAAVGLSARFYYRVR